MAPRKRTAPATPVECLDCGCSLEIDSHGGKRVVGKCAEAAELFAETKRAGTESLDPKIKGGAKVKLCREFARRRDAYHGHVFGEAV